MIDTLSATLPWIIFTVLIVGTLAIDLGLTQKKAHVVEMREALTWSAIWIGLALVFCAGIYLFRDRESAVLFLTGYLIEKALSVDNLFVFLVIFSYFKVPENLHQKVLFWGIIGAVIMRAILIGAGISLIQQFSWLTYLLGAFLIYTGIKTVLEHDGKGSPEKSPIVRWIRSVLPLSDGYDGERFFTRVNGRLLATPLFLVLVVIEITDVIFALDSIPAILGITLDPFLIYTSNLFAILGLRALYFALASLMRLFRYLPYGISAVLVMVGVEMVIKPWFHFSEVTTLLMIVVFLGTAVLASFLFPAKKAEID
jgi:tellurite resistance protein TerC